MTILCLALALCAAPPRPQPAVTVFVARKIVTMERRPSVASAVAVDAGRIVAVGTLDEVLSATKGRKAVIDRTFADKVLLPGFVALCSQGGPILPRQAMLRGGVTTAADLSGRDLEAEELTQVRAARDAIELPFRTILLPQGGSMLPGRRIGFLNAVALSHADARRIGVAHWDGAYQLLVSGAPDESLDALQRHQKRSPWDDHRYTILMTDKWSPAQCERLAKLGALAVLDPRSCDRAAALVKHKVRPALWSHKQPASPLALAGELSGVSVLDALRAITCDPAFVLRREKEIGTIAPGKRADFVVLDQDPLVGTLKHLKDVTVWGTVFEGRKQPARQAAGWDDRPKRAATLPTGTSGRHVMGLLGDDHDPRRAGKCDPSCPCRGGPRSKSAFAPTEPRRGR